MRIRELREEDLDDMLEIHRLQGWPFNESAFRWWLDNRRWSRVLVAEVEGRAVGKVTVDLVYRPYSEIVNLLVHPSYRGRGIGSALLDAALRLAEGQGFWVQIIMADVGNERALRLYRSRGFLPAIVPTEGRGVDCWLFRFSEGLLPKLFQALRPGSEVIASRGELGPLRECYKLSWRHSSGDALELYIRGQLGQPERGTMPRVAGCRVKLENVDLACWAREVEGVLGTKRTATFTLTIQNDGDEPCSIALPPVPIEGLEIKIKNSERAQVAPGDSLELAGELVVTPLLRAPPLSFSTVVGTVLIEASSLPKGWVLWASVGFERS